MFSLHIDTARTWRGGQNQVLQTVLGLRERGHRAALVASPSGELRRRADEGLELIPLTLHREFDLTAAWRLARALRELNPDLVHAHDPHGVAAASLALNLSRFQPKPKLVASRRVDFHLRSNSFTRWKYQQVDRFIAASRAIAEILYHDGVPRDRISVVYEGIDPDLVAAAPPADLQSEFWFPEHALVVGNVAALVPHKGHKYLTAAAEIVTRDEPRARFVIAGEGELRHELEQQVRAAGLEKLVILAGFRPDVLALHAAFDLFVLPSVTEGLGTSLLDAMAAGKAVVGTAAGGIPEAVGHEETGLIVPPRDPQALAVAIFRLLRDEPLRRRLGEAGRARVRERFTVDRMVEDTLEVYRQVVGSAA